MKSKCFLWRMFIITCFLFLSGCAMPIPRSYIIHSYSPSILMQGNGRVAVGPFRYIPNEQGKLRDNELSDLFYCSIYTERKVADYVKDAIIKEFKYIGYELDQGLGLKYLEI